MQLEVHVTKQFRYDVCYARNVPRQDVAFPKIIGLPADSILKSQDLA